MQTPKLIIKSLCILLVCQFATALLAKESEFLNVDDLQGEGPWIVLAHYQDKNDVLALKPFYDLWKIDEKNQTVLMVVENTADYRDLLNRGYSLELHKVLMAQQAMLQDKNFMGVKTINNFPCYRTVTETFDAMNDMQTNYPSLVYLDDIGDSWHKANAGGDPGHDMQVVVIANPPVVDANKPKLFAMGSIHSREYPPAELVTRFAEYLLSNYGSNADVTWLVDHHQIHLLLQGNPDGRIISEGESSASQRKNRNENHCFNGNQQGVDMNRNFEFLWNQGTGSSGIECSTAYRGTTPASEPETDAINSYIKSIFPDQRQEELGLNTPAPDDATGVYLDIHNVAELILFPWGYSDGAAQSPNHDQLQTLARRMAYFNSYRPEQSNSTLGGADGASDDNAYGLLGVAAYTIELGEGGFYSSCSAFENTIWPDNLPALIYAAKASRTPYITASGPDVIDLPPLPIQVAAGQMINVNGTATDLRFNNGAASTGNEPTQNITGIKAYLETPSWVGGATAVDMTAADGNFNSTTEGFTGVLDSTGLTEGRYTIWFEATDAAVVTGVPSAIFVDVVDPANLGTVAGEVRDADTNALIEQANVSYDGLMDMTDVNGAYSIQTSATSSDLTVNKSGYFEQTLTAVITTGGQTTTQNFLLEPKCEIETLNADVESFSDINQAISAGWSLVTGSGTNDWRVATGDNNTVGGTQAFISSDVDNVSDKSLVTPSMTLADDAELVFWHKHDFESGNDDYDGGVIEISTDGGSNWTDLGNQITQNGYNGTLNGGFSQPLGSVPAFVDNLGTYTEVKVDLSDYNNQTVNIRWRMGTDSSTSAGDWKVDDIRVLAPDICTGPIDLIFANGFENL